jgi:hypothetical protein
MEGVELDEKPQRARRAEEASRRRWVGIIRLMTELEIVVVERKETKSGEDREQGLPLLNCLSQGERKLTTRPSFSPLSYRFPGAEADCEVREEKGE